MRSSRRKLVHVATAASCTAVALLLAASPAIARASDLPIQDNSFLVEEAYNQEAGVVQTIQTYARVARTGDWVYTLTQEWPVPDVRNQLSFTVPVQGVSGASGVSRGLGDVALNYRYQLVGSGEAPLALSPRLTVLLPTGDERRALGSGGVGLQVGVPLSVVLSDRLVAHTNLGGTWVLSAKDGAGHRSDLTSLNAGQSLVWLVHPNVNVLMEAVVATNETLAADGGALRRTDAAISPGIRAALNLPGNFQVVAGLAFPVGIGASSGQRSLFLYLSAELPFWRPRS